MIIGLVLHLKLFALALSSIAGAIIGCLLIYYHFFKIIVQLVHLSKHTFYDWWPEFSSLIWRYAISWGSGFLVFQIFTPLTFYFLARFQQERLELVLVCGQQDLIFQLVGLQQ